MLDINRPLACLHASNLPTASQLFQLELSWNLSAEDTAGEAVQWLGHIHWVYPIPCNSG